MRAPESPAIDSRRRSILAVLVNSAVATFGGVLATLLGTFTVRPGATTRPDRWVRAAVLEDLAPGIPVARVVAVPRADGWYRSRARETVLLVWDGARDIKAFSATCTHLGCQVRWDPSARQLRCPCHGGAYGIDGAVIEGPPPRPLDAVTARVQEADGVVLVRL